MLKKKQQTTRGKNLHENPLNVPFHIQCLTNVQINSV